MWILWWILISLGSLAFIILLALSLPVHLEIGFNSRNKPRLSLRVRWLAGLVQKEMTGGRRKEKKKIRGKEVRRKKRRISVSQILESIRLRGVVWDVWRLVKQIWKLPKIKTAEMDMMVGLGDPADTGMLFSLVGPSAMIFGFQHAGRISLQPRFEDDPGLEGTASAAIMVRPILFLPPIFRFLVSPAVIKTGITMARNRWKREN